MANFTIKDIKGVIPAMVTPFDTDENVSEKGIRELVQYLLAEGVNGLYLTGSTGEGFLMSSDERKKVVEIVMEEVAGKVPVIVHVGAIGTKLSIELAKHAEAVGADAISSVPPFYWHFNETQIIEYYHDLATSVNIPMIVYNVPLLSLLGVETIKKLAKIENVKGIKYTAMSHHEITQIKDEIGPDFMVYSGADEMALSGLMNGADGIIGSFYNMLPDLFIEIYQAFINNDIEEAKRRQRDAVRIITYSLKSPSFYALMKAVLRWNGISAGYCRKPFARLSSQDEENAKEGYRKLKAEYDIQGVSFLDKL